MSKITIRAAESGDLLEIPELKLGAYKAVGYYHQDVETEEYLVLKENEYAIVAATKTDEVVGSMIITYDRGELYSDTIDEFIEETKKVRKISRQIAYYGTFAVPPELWRCGIGLALIKAAIGRAIDDGADAGICIVNPDHERFYVDLGFKRVASCANMPGLINAPGSMMVIVGEAAQDLIIRYKSGGCLFIRKSTRLKLKLAT